MEARHSASGSSARSVRNEKATEELFLLMQPTLCANRWRLSSGVVRWIRPTQGGGWRDQGKFSKGIRKQNELHRLRQRRGEGYRLIQTACIWVTRADAGSSEVGCAVAGYKRASHLISLVVKRHLNCSSSEGDGPSLAKGSRNVFSDVSFYRMFF